MCILSEDGDRGAIRDARRSAGITQLELARHAGTAQPAVAAYESGGRTPSLTTLQRLLGACEHDVELLIRPRVRRGAASLAELALTIRRTFGRPGARCVAAAVRVRRRLPGLCSPWQDRAAGGRAASHRRCSLRCGDRRRRGAVCGRGRHSRAGVGQRTGPFRRALVVRLKPARVSRLHARPHPGGPSLVMACSWRGRYSTVSERPFTRARILTALQALGDELTRQGVRGQIFIVGGAAMALAYSTRRVTRDIDAVFEPKTSIYTAAATGCGRARTARGLVERRGQGFHARRG